jgi:hypothetical protein
MIFAFALFIGCVSCFAPPSCSRMVLVSGMAAGSIVESAVVLKDSQGNDLKVGSIVRVVTSGLKAYQVNAKAHGSFVDGTFAPAPEGPTPRGKRNLELPVGIRGVVAKLYDVEDVSANFPIQVKFEPGTYNDDEGFDPPITFLMHFTESEVEAVL